VTRAFQAAASRPDGLTVRNVLFLGARPPEAAHRSNRTVGASAFVDAAHHDYHLSPRAEAIDAGVELADVTLDRAGTPRPQGRGTDVGAYERADSSGSGPGLPTPAHR
jgi:hypothetical protein